MVVPEIEGSANGIIQRGGVNRAHIEAGCRPIGERLRGAIDNGVCQSTSRCHDRDRPVAKTVELVQSTRFVVAWHDEHVRTGFDPVRQLVTKANVQGESVGVLVGQVSQFILESRFSASQHNPLRGAIFTEMPPQYGEDQIPALLLRQASDQANQGNLVARFQLKLFLKGPLVDAFALLP